MMVMVVAVSIMAVVYIWNALEEKRGRKRRACQRLKRFGGNPLEGSGSERCRERLEEIAVLYEETKGELPEGAVDEVTWNDLEMDEVFLRINQTESYIGEQVLYRRLHGGGYQDETGWERYEEQVRYLRENGQGREELSEELARIGKTREDYFLPMFLKCADMLLVEHLWVYRVLQAILVGSFVIGLATEQAFVLALFIVTALANLMIYTYSKEKYEVYLYSLGSVKRLIKFHRKLAEREEWRRLFVTAEQDEISAGLQKLVRYIGSFQRKKSGTMTGDMFDLARDYLIGVTLWDITSFARIARIIDGRQSELFLLYEACGEVDLAVSAASFRESLPGYCVPESGEGMAGQRFVAEGLYHPLISDPVCNDFSPERHVMITGANASGKSTFLKAVAVNAILAQTIHTAAAVRFVMPRMRVITSMAVRDDLIAGESYYIREVSYLKRIVDAVAGHLPVLCVIDEILRGTNTGERLAASEAVCRYLAENDGLTLVATHDMELAQKLSGLYACYYFQSDIRETDISFDYRLHTGLAGGQNAIRLLAYLDFPEVIVKMADQIYREFR